MSQKQQTDEFDSPWKEILDGYFPAFMALLFPAADSEIDWSAGYDTLDAELQQIVRDAEIGRRLADKLIRVRTVDGNALIVLVHTEIQGQYDANFAQRMFTYHYRIVDRYNSPVVSLAVLGDSAPEWHPQHYGYLKWGCGLEFNFPAIKLLSYRNRWTELENSMNPLATVIMAHLKALETRHDADTRKRWKMQLTRRMYEKGFEKQTILDIFRFIDWLMALPAELEQQFESELEQYEKENKMPYVTSIERRGIQKTLREGVLEILELRFFSVPYNIKEQLEEISDSTELRRLHRLAVQAESVEAFTRGMAN